MCKRLSGRLEAALFRPQTGYYADLMEEAAALWESLAQNHPFSDGPKPTSFAVTYTFLAINGIRITADPAALHGFMMENLEARTFQFERIVAWLRTHTS